MDLFKIDARPGAPSLAHCLSTIFGRQSGPTAFFVTIFCRSLYISSSVTTRSSIAGYCLDIFFQENFGLCFVVIMQYAVLFEGRNTGVVGFLSFYITPKGFVVIFF